MQKRQLLIIDKHPAVAKGLEHCFLECPEIEVVASVTDPFDGLDLLRRLSIDLVLIEPAMSGTDGAEVIRLLSEESHESTILAYSSRSDEASVFRALKAGARGYLLKSAPLSELVDAVRRVESEEYVISPTLSPTIVDFYLSHRDSETDHLATYETLTEREKQVFRLLADGWSTEEIGDILYISPKTVAKHRAAIKKKLDLDNVAEMAQYAIQIGVLTVDSAHTAADRDSLVTMEPVALPENN